MREQTPNPAVMKFVANMMFAEDSRYEFTTLEKQSQSNSGKAVSVSLRDERVHYVEFHFCNHQ